MKLPDDTRIAGDETVADWTIQRERLTNNTDPELWKKVFKDFFRKRLATRYFQPIRTLERMKQNKGEGFAIVALHCSLIEFLASTLEGKSYKYQRNGQPPLAQFEYSKSSDMFINFLVKREPFKTMFVSRETARDFYASVRCGLLHEARTKGQSCIKVCTSADQAIDANAKVIYRNLMQDAFDGFINWYGEALPTDAILQQAFIRKFDSLCNE